MAKKKSSAKVYSIRQKTHEGVDKIMNKAESMNRSSKETIARLREKTVMVGENVDDYITNNPKKSVLIAVGIGAFLGVIIAAAITRRKH